MNNVGKKIYSKYSFNYIKKKYDYLSDNINTTKDVYNYLNVRLVSSIVMYFMILYITEIGYILAPILTISYYFLIPIITLNPRIERKKKKLEKESLFFFEILTLSIEAGNNLHNALELTSNSIDSSISLEFRRTMSEVKKGKSLEESLEEMKKRIPSTTINNIILNLRESISFGNDIIETLNNQIDYIREKKLLETKAIINKMPLKISVVSVIFFIPLLLLLILGPVLINYLG